MMSSLWEEELDFWLAFFSPVVLVMWTSWGWGVKKDFAAFSLTLSIELDATLRWWHVKSFHGVCFSCSRFAIVNACFPLQKSTYVYVSIQASFNEQGSLTQASGICASGPSSFIWWCWLDANNFFACDKRMAKLIPETCVILSKSDIMLYQQRHCQKRIKIMTLSFLPGI